MSRLISRESGSYTGTTRKCETKSGQFNSRQQELLVLLGDFTAATAHFVDILPGREDRYGNEFAHLSRLS